MTRIMKKPDLNAPRFRPSKLSLLDQDFFKRFKEKFPKYKDISDSKLREIIQVYNARIWQTVLTDRDGAEFPEGLGYLFIGSCRSPKKFNMDFPTSQSIGAKARHRNFESDNYLAKIFYTNYASKYRFRHRELWQFKGIRQFTRKVAEVYPENWKIYLQVDNFAYISRIFRSKRKSQWVKTHKIHASENYNEFDMD
jgi:hypothetical protein